MLFKTKLDFISYETSSIYEAAMRVILPLNVAMIFPKTAYNVIQDSEGDSVYGTFLCF